MSLEEPKIPRRIIVPRRGRTRAQKKDMPLSDWIVEDIVREAERAVQPEESTSPSRSPVRKKRKESTTLTTDEVLKLIISMQKPDTEKSHRFSNNHLNNVVPEFDPASKSQSIESWIRKVNECAVIYEWNEKQTIHFALQKLTGLAKKWFESLPSVVFCWDDWQIKLQKAFPNEQNYGRLLEEMLGRTSRSNENLREYFYDKLTLVNRCAISGKNAVDCIIHGLIDKSIRNGAQALDCKEPEDLLNFLNSQRPNDSLPVFNKRRFDSSTSRPSTSSTPSTVSYSSVTCFNCHGKGHPFQKCPKPITRCQVCQRVGHNSETCRLDPLSTRVGTNLVRHEERKTMAISTQNNTNDKFFKKTEIDGRSFVAYIDFGSDSSLIRETDAQCLGSQKCFSNLPAIKGFGNSTVIPICKTVVNVKIDEIEAEIELLVVSDEFLSTPLLLGQDLTELPFVTVIKDYNRLFFYKNPHNCFNPNEKLNLTVVDAVEVAKVGLVAVTTSNPDFSGDIYLEGYTCGEPGRECRLHQGAYRIDCGRGHVVITNLMLEPLSIQPKTLIARATPFVEKEIRCVNRIYRDVTTLEPLEKSEINVGQDISEHMFDRLYQLLQSYRDCFALSLCEIGCISSTEMHIDLFDDKPVVYRPYRLSHAEREQVCKVVDELLKNDIIQESCSNYASPILMVRKKTGEQRLCIDFRALNNKTKKNCFPLPLIDDQLTNLSGNTFFTTLDLASGYYQIPMAKESQHLTAFVTPDGHYEFKRMPFGLANAPAIFQKVINDMLGSKRFESALAYLDDVLVPSVDLEQGFDRLEDVLKLLRENNLTLKLTKCRFFDRSINYLGYEISVDGIRPNENKIIAVKDFPAPKNVHEVRQFLGLAGYFRKFIKNFGEIARPLTNLLKKDSTFKWTEQEAKAFSSLKCMLIDRPILALYNPCLDTELHTDASALGIGGILMQWQESPRLLKPVAYFSRQTTPEERHLHSYELETLAIVCSLKKFRVYLVGINFKVITDCHALRTTLTKRDLVPRIARWWLQISEFTFSIEYRPGSRMAHVDALSRNTNLEIDSTDDPIVTVYNIEKENWLLTLQMTDPDILRIIKILRPDADEEVKDIKQHYVIKNHKVYRKVDDRLCLVVPRSARLQICKTNHDNIGHLGERKTLEKIQSQFWFPKMRRFVKKYLSRCIECAYNKDNCANKKTGHLYPIQKVSIPFHTVHIDHLGPFVQSKKGNAYILTIVDGFTKYVFAKAVKDTKTKSTLKVLENIFFDFGLPARIVSDRGTSFTSAAFKGFCDQHGIKHVLNAVACPRANGQAERFNQTILNALTKQGSGKDERDWDTWLGSVQWGINNTVNSTTQKTAAEVLFGVRLRDSLTNMLHIDTNITPVTLQDIRAEVSTNISTSQDKQKRRHDASRTPAPTYKEGDLIKITRTNYHNNGKSTKLLSKFIGPYIIVKVMGNDRYKITNVPGFNDNKRVIETVVAADRMRPWININPPVNTEDCLSDSSSDDSDDEAPLSLLQQRKTK